MSDYKIAFIDIENAPNLAYVWDKYQQDVIAYEREWNMLSFAVKWAGHKKVHVHALPDYPRYKRDLFDDGPLVKDLWRVFDEADLVVAHNAVQFDIRKANARFLFHDLTPPSPYRVVDTLLTARKHFKMNSNSLKDVANLLKIGQKVETGGFKLWMGCITGDPAAWKKMRRYNAYDVVLLEKVYYKMLPWMETHPNIALGSGKSLACPNCGKTEPIQFRGWRNLKTWRARSYWCNPLKGGCGKWPKGEREKLPGVILT